MNLSLCNAKYLFFGELLFEQSLKMKKNPKRSSASIKFYVLATLLIIAICATIGYAVHCHYTLQTMIKKNQAMIKKNDILDNGLFHFLDESKMHLELVERVLSPFHSTISFIFAIGILHLVGGWGYRLFPKRLKNFMRNKKENLGNKIETIVKGWQKKPKQ